MANRFKLLQKCSSHSNVSQHQVSTCCWNTQRIRGRSYAYTNGYIYSTVMGEMNISTQNNTSTFPLPIQLFPHQTTFPTRKDDYIILTDLSQQLRKTQATSKHTYLSPIEPTYPHLPSNTKKVKGEGVGREALVDITVCSD